MDTKSNKSFTNEQTVLVINPLDEDFIFQAGGVDYEVKAGKTTKMIGYMARLFVDKIVNEIMQQDEKTQQMGIDTVRATYEDKVIVEVEDFIKPMDIQDAGERQRAEYERLNNEAEASMPSDETMANLLDGNIPDEPVKQAFPEAKKTAKK